jgi:hypothetical protein
MTNKLRSPPATLANQPNRKRPVRVKLRSADSYVAQAYPPDGQSERWWTQLNTALGTVSSDFVNTSLFQLQTAARSPFGNISETAMNAALAMIAAIAPKDEIEGAFAVQMSCTHAAAMAVLAKMNIAFGTERRVMAFGSTAARLLRTYAMQMEVLRRLRNGGQQCIRLEHVHIDDGGIAVIGGAQRRDT